MCGKTEVKFGFKRILIALRIVDTKCGRYTVIGFRNKSLYLAFTFNNEPNRYALHTSCTKCWLHFSPQNGREFKAH